MKDFFVSYNSTDRTWAEWVAWVLEEHGYRVIIQAWDFRPGGNFILDMQRATAEAERTVMVLSDAYLQALYTQPEWAAAFKQDPIGRERKLLPIRVSPCQLTGMLAPLVYVDLVGKSEAEAEALLLAALKDRAKPANRPTFTQSDSEPERATSNSVPSGDPNPFEIPYQRNRYFTGRQSVLERLHQQLNHATTAAITQVQAISGLGGIGKTQVAVEYAYRYHYDQSTYDIVFWVKADTEANLTTDFANLAKQLALPVAKGTQDEQIPDVKDWLDKHDNWLLIFDNADTPDWLIPLMPNNPKGKVIITSRATVFDQLGIDTPLALDVLPPEDAINLLFRRTGYGRTAASSVAATDINQELGGLPLALEQASAFMLRRRIGFRTYLNAYRKRGLPQLEQTKAKTGQYPSSVLKTWVINFQAVLEESLAASELLKFSSFLAPNDIPYRILIKGSAHLGKPLKTCLQCEDDDDALLQLSELLEPLSQYSLVRWEPEQPVYSVHRLVQAVVRDGMDSTTQASWIRRAAAAIETVYPGYDFKHWPICAQLLPHWLQVHEHARPTGIESKALGGILNQAGFYLHDQGRYKEAEPLYQEALALRKRLFRYEHPDVATSLNNLALLYRAQGRYREAEPLYQEALALRKRLFRYEHPDVATSLHDLAGFYRAQGSYREAEPLYQEALALTKRLFGYKHPDVATSLNNLALLYRAQGRYREAEPLFQEALDLYKQLLGDEHPYVATGLNNLALLYRDQGRYREAEPLFQEALDLYERLLGDEHPNTTIVRINLDSLERGMNQDQE